MVDIKTKYINIYNDKLNCTIEYPEIYIKEKYIFIQQINSRIKEDINIFIVLSLHFLNCVFSS